jgi:hypothetical protein
VAVSDRRRYLPRLVVPVVNLLAPLPSVSAWAETDRELQKLLEIARIVR